MRLVGEETFQEDLFYRLDGVKIRIPPLRERLDDIPELVDYFIARHSRTMGKRVTGATSETIRLLMSAQWKGNVRQLDNAVERAVMMCDGTAIEPSDLPPRPPRTRTTPPRHRRPPLRPPPLRTPPYHPRPPPVARQTRSRQKTPPRPLQPLPKNRRTRHRNLTPP